MQKPPHDPIREPDQHTVIAPSGLRYTSKQSGSPFAAGFVHAAMSCFRCGAHRSRAQLMHRKLLGKSRLVCAQPCPR